MNQLLLYFLLHTRKVSKLCTERPNECYFAKGRVLTVDLRQNKIFTYSADLSLVTVKGFFYKDTSINNLCRWEHIHEEKYFFFFFSFPGGSNFILLHEIMCGILLHVFGSHARH